MNREIELVIRMSFFAFMRKAFTETHLEKLDGHHYLEYLCYILQQFSIGIIKRLNINLPPRHLKTFVASICLTCWILGNRPSAKVLILSYGEKRAQRIAFEIREMMRSRWYKSAFDTRLAVDRTQVGDFITTEGGGVYSASIDGSVTGYGADVILVDDPSEIPDAASPETMARVNQRFDGLIESRLNNPEEGCIGIIAHRIHELDLSGHVLAEGGWRRVVLPLIAPRRARYDLGGGRVWIRRKGSFLRPNAWTRRRVEKKRVKLINPDFQTLYQQDPSGTLHSFRIKEEHFPLVSLPRGRSFPIVVASVDPSQAGGTSNSFGVVQVWAPLRDEWLSIDHLLLHQWRAQEGYDEIEREVWRVIRHYRPAAMLIEKAGIGEALISRVKQIGWLRVEPISPSGRSKAERFVPHKQTIQSKHIMLPDDAEWRFDFIEELKRFPRARFNDQVDALTQYLAFMATGPRLEPPPIHITGALALGSQGTFAKVVPHSNADGHNPGIGILATSRGTFRI